MNSSPQRGTFHSQCKIRDAEEQGIDPATDPQVLACLEFEKTWQDRTRKLEADPEWQKNNLEYDLRSTKWICDKAREREEYAQNLYAAMCNRDWQKNDVWPLLKGQTYSCSWRYAGGIVADMIGSGDYIDWYCSGIRGHSTEEDLAKLTQEERARCEWYDKHFVNESVVTDEIREDLFKLGWIPVDDPDMQP